MSSSKVLCITKYWLKKNVFLFDYDKNNIKFYAMQGILG